MKRSRYGNIEDMVLNCDLVTAPDGLVHRRLLARARSSHGPEVQQPLFGSEGNFGVIVSATVKVHKLAARQNYGAYVFADWQTGVRFLRDLHSAGMTPAACRLVDNDQFRFGRACAEQIQ